MSVQIRRSAQGQAMPRETVALPKEAFGPSDTTTVYWLGNAGFLLNSRGTTIMCDPLLVGFDMPTLVEPPILPADVPAFDALLYTHIDNDHFARETLAGIALMQLVIPLTAKAIKRVGERPALWAALLCTFVYVADIVQGYLIKGL